MYERSPRRALRSQLRLQQLQMLLRLIECGTVRGAAVQLALSQSAVTKSLKELESLIGVPLFDRDARGLRPTPYCAPLEEYARETLLGLENALEAVRALVAGRDGRIGIGVNSGKAEQLLGWCLPALRAAHPRTIIYQRSDRSLALMQQLKAGELDFALLSPPRQIDRSRYSFLPVASDRLLIVAAPTHPLARLPLVPAAALIEAAWVLPPPGDPVREAIAFALLALGTDQPADLIECNADDAALQLALEQRALAVVPEAVAQPRLRQGDLVEVRAALPLPSLRYGVVRLRRREMRAPAGAALATLLRRLRELRGRREAAVAAT